MRIAARLLACSLGLAAIAQVQAQTNVVSDAVGFYKVNINVGKNFISSPMHNVHAYRGLVSSLIGTNQVVFNGSPNFTANTYSNVTLGGDVYTQYILVVRKDKTPGSPVGATGPGNDVTGDWWPILTNDTTSVTVNTHGDDLTKYLEAGDQMEIRKLMSLKDIFGTGVSSGTLILNTNSSTANVATGDVIRVADGTPSGGVVFTRAVIYKSGGASGEGYYKNAFTFIGDGSQVTFEPNEPIYVQRATSGTATNITAIGQVHSTPLTTYFNPGANTYGMPFPAPGTISNSGLTAVVLAAGATNGQFNTQVADGMREVQGSGFINSLYVRPDSNWFNLFTQTNSYNFNPGRGWVYYVKPSTGGRVWRQNLTFTP